MKPETCGQCERYDDGYCTPIKEKYGLTPVEKNYAPYDGCPYEESHCYCGDFIVNGYCVDKECKNYNKKNENKD
jgi:hypothetical protein